MAWAPSVIARRNRSVQRVFASEGSRQPWEFGRFLKTVLYFNNPLQTILKALTPKEETSQPVSKGASSVVGTMEASAAPVLVLGGETEIGTCLVEYLTKSGTSVCAAASDIEQLQVALKDVNPSSKGTLDMVDWSKDVSAQMSSVIICTPLASYIKKLSRTITPEKTVYNPSEGVESMSWGPLDDVVMGGCSQSELKVQKGKGDTAEYAAIFSGNITSANNGGFASVRTKNIEPMMDFTGFDGLKLKLRGDGQRYKFMLRTTADWDSIAYCQSFDTKAEWQEVVLPFKDFFPVFRAKSVSPPTPLQLDSISSLQLMLSKFEYDGNLNPSLKMGRFELPIESISLYKEGPRVILVGGSEEDRQMAKTLTQKYVIVDPDNEQTVPMKDSTFVQFCWACLSEEAALNTTFKETTRSIPEEALPFEQLVENFSKE